MSSKKKDVGSILNKIIYGLLTIIAIIFYLLFGPEQESLKQVEVHFIDVGQADCIFVQTDEGNMLIDVGESQTKNKVIEYLKSKQVSAIDYLVATHPHSDHIGGMDAIVNAFDIKNVYMPNVTHTTATYERFLKSIQNKSIKPHAPLPGEKFKLGSVNFTVLAPNSEKYDDLNNYSIVLKMQYGSNSFLFTGDAEALSENEILRTGENIMADVLKAGHHGSSSSTSTKFLDAVNPRVCVITCGKGNDYGHPHKETIAELGKRNIRALRTDELGTIVIKTDGVDLTFNNEKL